MHEIRQTDRDTNTHTYVLYVQQSVYPIILLSTLIYTAVPYFISLSSVLVNLFG